MPIKGFQLDSLSALRKILHDIKYLPTWTNWAAKVSHQRSMLIVRQEDSRRI